MKQYIIASFVSKHGGGNLAAVVLDDKGLSEEQMLEMAKKNNLSETAFVDLKNSDNKNLTIRYFTPVEEVDICGHAALASFYLLNELGSIDSHGLFHKTKAGKLRIIKRENMFFIQMKEPKIVDYFSIDEVMDFTTLKENDILPNRKGNISIVSTGLKDAIIIVSSLKVLKDMKIYRENMIYHCNKKNIIGAHVVSRETIEDDSDFAVRNFAPAVGIDEESATGTSNASLIYYMIDQGLEERRERPYKIEQGYFMKSPSNIYVYPDYQETIELYVGGKAEIIHCEELYI